jgi:hypothetical protein
MQIYIFCWNYSLTYVFFLGKALDRVVTPSSIGTNMQSFDSPIFDPTIHVNTLFAPSRLSYVIGSKKCAP